MKISEKTRKNRKSWLRISPDAGSDIDGTENFYISAFDLGTGDKLGHIEVIPWKAVKTMTGWKDTIVVANVYVEARYQRKGIATAMYDFAENFTRKKLAPYEFYDPNQPMSEDGKNFWRARRPGVEFDDDNDSDD